MKEKIEDGYKVIPPLRAESERIKGVKCGQCGMKFPYSKPVMFSCNNIRCPIMQNPTYDRSARTFSP